MKLLGKILNRNPFLSVYKRANIWRNELGSVGENVQIFHKVSFGSEPYLIKIGDKTKITYGCKFITHDGGTYVLRNIYNKAKDACVYGRIEIGKNCFIGNDVIILPGVTIGDNCVIAAGAIVTKSIPSNSVAGGVPCKALESIEEYYAKTEPYFIYTKNMDFEKKKQYIISSGRLIEK